MSDFNARHVVEALRSGVPSRAVGEYFSEARPAMMKRIRDALEGVSSGGRSAGMIFTGRYGEGKTHLLNTVFSMAAQSNMAVSMISLGKESPVDKPWLLYQKLAANTYLPGARQPGFRSALEELTPGSAVTGELLAYASRELDTDRHYFLLKALLNTQEEEERAAFLADLEGAFATGAAIKRSFRRITGAAAKFSQPFSKRRHSMDYFYFLSHLFRALGCSGWVILLDEAELIGRMGKAARGRSYRQMDALLHPDPRLEATFTLFAMSSSYAEDVIDRKHEFENVKAQFAEDPGALKAAGDTLNAILSAPELAPLNRDEILNVLSSIQDFHSRAYDWHPQVEPESIFRATEAGGYLLRTKIRAAIEFFDQLYQYGEAGQTRITALGKESFEEEEETPELDEL